jgi:hypothetical protein
VYRVPCTDWACLRRAGLRHARAGYLRACKERGEGARNPSGSRWPTCVRLTPSPLPAPNTPHASCQLPLGQRAIHPWCVPIAARTPAGGLLPRARLTCVSSVSSLLSGPKLGGLAAALRNLRATRPPACSTGAGTGTGTGTAGKWGPIAFHHLSTQTLGRRIFLFWHMCCLA